MYLQNNIMQDHSTAKLVAKGALIFLAGLMLIKVLAFLFRVIVSRQIGAENYGVFSLALAVFNIFLILGAFGLNFGVSRFVGYYKGIDDKSKIKGTILTAYSLILPITIILSSIMYFGADYLAILFKNTSIIYVLKIFAFALPATVLLTTTQKALEAFQKIKYSVYAELTRNATMLALAVILLLSGFGLFGVSVSFAIGGFVGFFIAAILLRKKTGIFTSKIKSVMTYKTLLTYSWPLIFSSMITPAISWSDTLILGYFRAATEVGLYSVALQTAGLIIIFLTAANTVTLPLFSEKFSTKNIEEIGKIYKTQNRWLLMLLIPVLLIFLFFSKEILNLLFGSEYATVTAAIALSIIAVGFFFHAVTNSSGGILLAIGKTKLKLMHTIAAFSFSITASILLIPKYGILGAAIAAGGAPILANILRIIAVYQILKLKPFSFKIIKVFIAVIFPIITVSLIFYIFSVTKITIIISLILGAIIYFYFLRRFKCIKKEDAEIIKAIEARLGLKIFSRFFK